MRFHHRSEFQLALLATALSATLGACKAPPLPEPETIPEEFRAPPDQGFTRLGSFDRVRVVVFGNELLSEGPDEGQLIDAEGKLHLPLVGSVALAGLTVDEAVGAIEARLATYMREPHASLAVLDYGHRRINLLGEFVRPGSYELERPLTALQALSLGGGFTSSADREEVALLRAHGDELNVHFLDAATPGADGMIPVLPGDVLFIRQTGAGTFREQVLPILQGLVSPVSALASLIVVTDRFND